MQFTGLATHPCWHWLFAGPTQPGGLFNHLRPASPALALQSVTLTQVCASFYLVSLYIIDAFSSPIPSPLSIARMNPTTASHKSGCSYAFGGFHQRFSAGGLGESLQAQEG